MTPRFELPSEGDDDLGLTPPTEDLPQEDLAVAERLSSEYRSHMRRRGRSEKGRPVHEVTAELQDLLGWLGIDDLDSVKEHSVARSRELYMDYSVYDVEDLYFVVLSELKGRRPVKFDDLVHEPKETDLLEWKAAQTKGAAEFLIVHGVNENEINEWKSERGSGRQQRAMRRMFWLLNEPFMAHFTEWLYSRAMQEAEPYNFAAMAYSVQSLLLEQKEIHEKSAGQRTDWIPRKQDEYDDTTVWLERAMNICEKVFMEDIQEGIY